jgi:hypothetical protein
VFEVREEGLQFKSIAAKEAAGIFGVAEIGRDDVGSRDEAP